MYRIGLDVPSDVLAFTSRMFSWRVEPFCKDMLPFSDKAYKILRAVPPIVLPVSGELAFMTRLSFW